MGEGPEEVERKRGGITGTALRDMDSGWSEIICEGIIDIKEGDVTQGRYRIGA